MARWSTPQKQPDQCASVFSWLRSKALLTPALAEARVRAALAADNPKLARDFLVDVPAERAASLLQWTQLLESPKAPLALLAISPTTPVEGEALAGGFNRAEFQRLCRCCIIAARTAQASGPDACAASAAAAIGGSWRGLEPGAGRGRRVRSAARRSERPFRSKSGACAPLLWAGDFAKALGWLEKMPPALAGLPRWRYWHARAVGATAGESLAAPLYAEIAGLRDYYGYLAADRLKQSYQSERASPRRTTPRRKQRSRAEAGLVRAHALFDCDMADDRGGGMGCGPDRRHSGNQGAGCASRVALGLVFPKPLRPSRKRANGTMFHCANPRPYAAAVADAESGNRHPRGTGSSASCDRRACSERTRCRVLMRAA